MNHNTHAAQLNSSHWNGSDKTDNENLIKKEDGSIFISPRALTIIWGNSDRFWKWVDNLSERKFGEGAELIQVSWIEVTGKVEVNKLSHFKNYDVIFHIKFKDDAFGWHHTPVIFEVVTPDGKNRKSVVMETYRENKKLQEINAGDFYLRSGHRDKEIVRFGMYEVESQWWKGGLILVGVELRPKKASSTTSRGIEMDEDGKGGKGCLGRICCLRCF